MTALPPPECRLGFSPEQLRQIFGMQELGFWKAHPYACVRCDGTHCERAHGLVAFAWDVEDYHHHYLQE